MTLRRGSKGAVVEAWQRRLAAMPYSWRYLGEIEGDFGPMTEEATKEYQRLLKECALYGGAIDGIVGPVTRGADAVYAKMLGVPPAGAGGALPAPDGSGRIYDAAAEYLGVKETPGRATTAAIAEMFRLAPSWLDQDDSVTAWCGIFRGYVGHVTATGMPAQHYRAAAWLEWGQPVPLEAARRGDTVILSRTGGHHVALYVSTPTGGTVRLLGGNQGNAVSLANFAAASVKGIRR
jgi:uncharacterized protein (TIGR02594 family)